MRAGETSKEVDQITVDGKVLLYGRSADYQSCEDRGKHPATVAYQFKDDGSFEKLADLNTLFYENEAFPYALSPTSLVSAESACEGDGKDFVVDLTVKEGTITYTNKRASDAERRFGYYSYQDRIEQLEKEIGIASKIRYMHALPDSTVVSLGVSPKNLFGPDQRRAPEHQHAGQPVERRRHGILPYVR